ncbi:bifunctional phosphopantothenoylcysteine decarboxylase/phosphopantothenate--cysteine ligase CoaBC [Aerococcus kribbianus]|uniref:Coenzyme A biosynthesis bifunctional protein CoaBC n=1 Tax=Aerococcus kribbianus TaxID=2999064 RepID=A0A9X3FPL2_9LACT|nr:MULTISPECIES: bifunctional phosphopantothenoylcysteine decarboxylase/phosphopantothenate--cysteine ligase CoaBC [unclassified Aerococcus]MCZ0717241.1 bifunctional phosphopantothenoylcysteine decarboxylase/phosphopantothenate--cysteine ligase CoaBC [Aerococcus sp. YH-aer221]MCZ0725529.1 bifunctional phosphopantothenoylcysteine decarboxylase/phosphopantothenate--cysteine ligase CoaBC [Aerococcus sp. YH-aer222]
MLAGKHIVVAISGGIAAYKVPMFVRALIKAGAQVRVTMTPQAQRFVTSETLAVLSKYPVLVEGQDYPEMVGHVALADWADAMVLLPATANSLTALATGRADNEMLSSLMASHSPLLLVPAMNHNMWQKASLQRQIAQLRKDGYYVIEPAYGFLAEGYQGKGRMPETDQVFQALSALMAIETVGFDQKLQGKRVLVSAGGTREALDPVRYLSNHSSGKMGIAIAHVAAMLGAEVSLVRTESTLNLPVLPSIDTITVSSAVELNDAMTMQEGQADIIIMAAAVSDYRAEEVAGQKMKKDKTQSKNRLNLSLVENPDILANLPKANHYVVGFAAETQDVVAYAQAKLQTKGADMIVANDVSDRSIGFASEDNAAYLVTQTEVKALEKSNKMIIASQILAAVLIDSRAKKK